MLKNIFGLLSPAGTSGRLSVLIFHRVLSRPDQLCHGEVDACRFDAICQWIKAWSNVLPLDEAIMRLRTGNLPARAVAITFDDGYADNYTEALPILQRHGLTATFFIATQFLDGGRMWNDTIIEAVRGCKLPVLHFEKKASLRALELGLPKVLTNEEKQATINAILSKIKYRPPVERADLADQIADVSGVDLPTDLMLTSTQVKKLRLKGMQIGAHTLSHPILARLNRAGAFKEIAGSKEFLQGLLGERIGLFAYPNGKPGTDYSRETIAISRELGFDAAVTTEWGAASFQSDPYQIPRFTPWDKTRLRFASRLIRNLKNPYSEL